jgi:hypothetical protein
VYAGVGAPLQTTVENRGGSTSCVGDTVSYTCTAGGSNHGWRITLSASNVTTVSINRVTRTAPVPGGVITIASDDMDNNVIITVLTVTSFAGLNGASISCTDTGPVNGTVQETTVAVFGECCYDHAHAWSIAPLGAVTGAPTS